MADEQIALTLAKSDEPFDMPSIKFNQMELGKKIDVTITDIDGKPYDLTDKQLQFVDKFTDSAKGIIIDDGSAGKGGVFDRTDDKNGKFTYTLQSNAYQGTGKACFEIASNGSVVDTTNPFYIDIQFSLSSDFRLENATYISDLQALEGHFQSILDNANAKTGTIVKDLQAKAQEAIANGQKSIDDELKSSKAQIDDLTKKTNELLTSFTTALSTDSKQLADLQTAWETVSKQLKEKADQEITNTQVAFNKQLQDFQTKADKAVSDWNAGQSEELAKKADQSEVDTLNHAINTKEYQCVLDKLSDSIKNLDQSALDKKADKESVNSALLTKANKTDLDALSAAVDKKANLSDLSGLVKSTDLNTTLADYAKTADVDSKLATKAEKTDVDNLTAEVTKKADEAELADYAKSKDVTDELATKANQKSVDDLTTVVGTKANTSTLANYDTITDVDEKLLKKADKKTVDDLTTTVDTKAGPDEINALKQQITTLQSKNDELSHKNDALQQQLDTVAARKWIVHVKSVDDVNKYPDTLVIVDDPTTNS